MVEMIDVAQQYAPQAILATLTTVSSLLTRYLDKFIDPVDKVSVTKLTDLDSLENRLVELVIPRLFADPKRFQKARTLLGPTYNQHLFQIQKARDSAETFSNAHITLDRSMVISDILLGVLILTWFLVSVDPLTWLWVLVPSFLLVASLARVTGCLRTMKGCRKTFEAVTNPVSTALSTAALMKVVALDQERVDSEGK